MIDLTWSITENWVLSIPGRCTITICMYVYMYVCLYMYSEDRQYDSSRQMRISVVRSALGIKDVRDAKIVVMKIQQCR